MAAILIADCTVTMITPLSGLNVYKIVTPASADNGDTIDCKSIFPNAIVLATAECATDKNLLCTLVNYTLTLPGATVNEARTIYAVGY